MKYDRDYGDYGNEDDYYDDYSGDRPARYRRQASVMSFDSLDIRKQKMIAVAAIVTASICLIACIIVLLSGGKNSGGNSGGNTPAVGTASSPSDETELSPSDSEGGQGEEIPSAPDDTSSADVSSDTSANVSSEGEKSRNNALKNTAYSRSKVKKSQAATLTVSNIKYEGFDFSLKLSSTKISGYAKFKSDSTAEYSNSGGKLTFSITSSGVSLTMSGKPAGVGVSKASDCEGLYVSGNPEYIEDVAEKSEFVKELRKSTMVISALKSTLGESDYELYELIVGSGSELSQLPSELSYDKNGKEIYVDAEMKCIKYIYQLQNVGEVILLCSGGGSIYCAVGDGTEYRYYSNDKDYKSKAPKCISNTARLKEDTLRYMSK
ncbi:MAG: hypothetical protein LBL82_05395 [Oscillospiraceae bacterium]|jgi:hypothetical protein|nr:hypothetical protein [Oscillospiraceae bacterium]